MTRDQINAGASAIVDAIRLGTAAKGIGKGDMLAMASVAIVEIVGQAAGPRGAAQFFRDLADQIEADHVRRLA